MGAKQELGITFDFEAIYASFTKLPRLKLRSEKTKLRTEIADGWLRHFPNDFATILRKQDPDLRMELVIRLGLRGLHEHARNCQVMQDGGFILNYIEDYYRGTTREMNQDQRLAWYQQQIDIAIEEIDPDGKIRNPPALCWQDRYDRD